MSLCGYRLVGWKIGTILLKNNLVAGLELGRRLIELSSIPRNLSEKTLSIITTFISY